MAICVFMLLSSIKFNSTTTGQSNYKTRITHCLGIKAQVLGISENISRQGKSDASRVILKNLQTKKTRVKSFLSRRNVKIWSRVSWCKFVILFVSTF